LQYPILPASGNTQFYALPRLSHYSQGLGTIVTGCLTIYFRLLIPNKIILYTQVIRPVWSYGIQLWGCASDANIQVIQRYQNKLLKCIVNAPWYVRNSDLHRDLGIETVTDMIAKFAKSYEKRLQDHINIEASRLLNVNKVTRRLKRKKPFELVRR
jgi:uncharacterized protein YeeX (DUF496 family)